MSKRGWRMMRTWSSCAHLLTCVIASRSGRKGTRSVRIGRYSHTLSFVFTWWQYWRSAKTIPLICRGWHVATLEHASEHWRSFHSVNGKKVLSWSRIVKAHLTNAYLHICGNALRYALTMHNTGMMKDAPWGLFRRCPRRDVTWLRLESLALANAFIHINKQNKRKENTMKELK